MAKKGKNTDLKLFGCKNCGAQLAFSPTTQGLKCNYCGGSFDIENPEDIKITEPEKIIPFSVDDNEFKERILSWLIEGEYTPLDILNSSQFEGYSGTYFPVFQFKGTYDGNWSASSGYKRQESYVTRNSEGKAVTKYRTVTDWNPSNGKVSGHYDILCYAGKNIKTEVQLFSETCTYTGSAAKAFDRKYTLNFPLIAFDIQETDGWDHNGNHQLDDIVTAQGRQAVPGDVSKDFRCDFTSDQKSVSSIHVPVWFTYYEYKDKYYYAALDGDDSSHIEGVRPQDEGAIAEAKSKFLWRNILGWGSLAYLIVMFISFMNAGYRDQESIFVMGIAGTVIGLIATAIAHSMGNSAKQQMIADNLAKRKEVLEQFGKEKQLSLKKNKPNEEDNSEDK